ncbi:acyl-CoA desaturase [Thiohalorhabdus sp. Cl-TMA]|uniref:Acyl-CoA desaturase n=1 Tax=Thiohalorhabdus methylotrophus TaxID=3242694 RepID=A0ABV4TWS1_9GAMM
MNRSSPSHSTTSSWWRLLISDLPEEAPSPRADRLVEISRWGVFLGLHAACLAVFWVGISPFAVALAVALYLGRMFFITAFYHRYFSHKAFRASRWFQLAMAVTGCTAGQRGPLWWAGHHRFHHAHSDTSEDRHSPAGRGMFIAHMGWFMRPESYATPWKYVRDWAAYPELRWVNRFDMVPFLLLGAGLYGLGAWLETAAPALGTDGPQLFVWGFLISTVVLYHATYTINSLAHSWGRRPYATGDDSRNNGILALLTLGEGWHNNHHFYPGSARQGFLWWEVDPTYYALRALERLALIWDLRPVPASVLAARPAGGRKGGAP